MHNMHMGKYADHKCIAWLSCIKWIHASVISIQIQKQNLTNIPEATVFSQLLPPIPPYPEG